MSGTEYRSEFYSDVYEETFEVYAEEFDISNCFDQTMQQTVIIQFNSQDSSEIQSHLLQFQRKFASTKPQSNAKKKNSSNVIGFCLKWNLPFNA